MHQGRSFRVFCVAKYVLIKTVNSVVITTTFATRTHATSRSNIPPNSYGQSNTPLSLTNDTNAVLSNSSNNQTPSSTSNTNTVPGNNSAIPTPSTSNSNAVDNTRKKGSSPKTRIRRSPRLRQAKGKDSPLEKMKMPVSARKRELDKRNQNGLAGSSSSESEKKIFPRSGALNDSFEDDVLTIKDESILDATSEEEGSPNQYFSEPQLSVRTRYDSDETLSSSSFSQPGVAAQFLTMQPSWCRPSGMPLIIKIG